MTTSTTEAELAALARAGAEYQWWRRFFDQLGFYPGALPAIECDNQQTVGIVNKSDPVLSTKLRHIDVRQHWLRQEVQSGRISVTWIPTGKMIADGLTKHLPRQKHVEFVRMLGLKDITDRIDLAESS